VSSTLPLYISSGGRCAQAGAIWPGERPLQDPRRLTVEVVQLAAGERLRIWHDGFYVADVANVDDLARWIPAAELAQLERDAFILAA
jgi:hypothetical protein